jgi:Ca2+-binding RTX toxin-like protein
VYGGGGDDFIYGDAGADFLRDGTGIDIVNGGEGNDVILIDADGVADTVNGAGGAADALDLGLAAGPTNVTFGAALFAGVATGGFMGTTSFSGIECVYGSNAFADFMYGGAGGEYLYSRGGDDFLSGGGGNDIIDGGAGTDSLFGGAGADLFDFDPGSGQDNIYDFTDNVDTLRFDPAYGFATAQDVVNATVAVGNHALILLPGNLGIYLVNYLVSNTISSLLDDIIIG